MHLKRKKTTAIASNVIGASARDELVRNLQKSKFSILSDESTDIASKKSTCVLVRFYNPKAKKITSSFLGLVDLFRDNEEALASAEVIYERIVSIFVKNSIPMANCIGFGSDGCNTMMGAHNSVMTRFQEACPGIYISKCICHSLHICASNAAKCLPRRCEDLVKDVYNFLKQSAKRKTVFSKFQELASVPIHQMLHPAQTRWLSFYPAVNRLLEQWDALLLFFQDCNQKDKLESVDRILQNLTNPSIKLYYQFLNWVLPKFNALNAFFQSAKVVLTTAHIQICSVFKEFLASFLKSTYIDGTDLTKIDPYCSTYLLDTREMYLGTDFLLSEQEMTRNSLSNNIDSRKQTSEEINEVKIRCRSFLQTACKEMQKRYSFSDPILTNVHIFSPRNAIDSEIRQRHQSLSFFANQLPRCKPDGVSLQIIDDEWRSLPYAQLSNDILEEKEVDVFWSKLATFCYENEILLFQNVATFVCNILSLPHSNADCERIFSSVNNIKTKLRNKLVNNTLNGVLLAKEFVCSNGDCVTFEPTKEMYGRFNSNMYDGVDTEDEF